MAVMRLVHLWRSPRARAVLIVLAGLSCSDPVAPVCTERVSGRCWTYLGLDGEWVTAIADTPWGLFAATRGDYAGHGVFRYDPASGEWRSLGLDHAVVSSIVFVPTDPPRLLVGVFTNGEVPTEAALFASFDAGRTWLPWDGGLAARRGGYAGAFSLAVDRTNPDRLLMGLSYPVLRSEDAGRTWSYVYKTEGSSGAGVSAIVQSPMDPERVWAGGQTAFFTPFVLRSHDFGTNWRWFDPTPRVENVVNAILANPEGAQAVLIGMNGGVFRSDDDGVTWRLSLAPRSPGVVFAFAATEGQSYAVSSENFRPPPSYMGPPDTDLGVYQTRDAGATWDSLPVPTGVRGGQAAAIDGQGRLLIGTWGSGVWRMSP